MTDCNFDLLQYVNQTRQLPTKNKKQRRSKVAIFSKRYKKICHIIQLLPALERKFQSHSKCYLYKKKQKKKTFVLSAFHKSDIVINELQVTSYDLISLRVAFIARVTSYFLHMSDRFHFIARVTSYFLHTNYELLFMS